MARNYIAVRKYIAPLVLAFVLTAGAYSAPNDVAVLYSGNSSVNSNALHFMTTQFNERSSYKLKGIRNPADIKPAMYKAVLVLNTGLKSGIDPVLSGFITSWSNKPEIILINIRKGSSDLTVTQLPPSPETLGVDAVSAASKWTGKGFGALFGGKSTPEYDMHVDWTGRVIKIIDNIR